MTIRPAFRALSIALALCGLATVAQAQWKWKDASGRVQYSDRPPPAGTADKDILQRPAVAVTRVKPIAGAASGPLDPAASAAAAGVDPALEARKQQADKQLADAESAKKKAEDEKLAQTRAANCRNAQTYLRSLQDGQRIARSNDKGERIYIDDAERARETQRAQQAVSSDCR